jgi:hypothetical protein
MQQMQHTDTAGLSGPPTTFAVIGSARLVNSQSSELQGELSKRIWLGFSVKPYLVGAIIEPCCQLNHK